MSVVSPSSSVDAAADAAAASAALTPDGDPRKELARPPSENSPSLNAPDTLVAKRATSEPTDTVASPNSLLATIVESEAASAILAAVVLTFSEACRREERIKESELTNSFFTLLKKLDIMID
jgi:hypothetical protein